MLIYGDADVKLDVLAIGPHPDDAEIGAGGVLHKLSTQGRSVTSTAASPARS